MTDPFEDFSTAPRHESGAPKGKAVRNIFIVLAVLLVAGGGAIAAYTMSLARGFDEGRTVVQDVFPDEESRPAAPEPESDADKAINILLLGSDTRGEIGDDIDAISGSRSDAIMVMHIPAERDDVQVMSIMRDNWVPIVGHGHDKINAALAYGGVPLMVGTVENFIGARIDHIAVIDFDGFEGLTNALGGVTIYNEVPFTADGFSYVAGENHLNGKQALRFVRERKSFNDGDYQRARNQQAYIKGVISTMLSRNTLTSPTKISDAVKAIAPYLTTDADLDSKFVAGLGFEMRDIRSGDIRFFTSPTLGTGWAGSQSIVEPDWDRIDELRTHFQEDTLEDYTP